MGFFDFMKKVVESVDSVKTYTVVDVETPNYDNDRISSISVTKMKGDKILWTKTELVDPEAPFSRFHQALTGITPQMVCGKPKFPNVWSWLGEELKGSFFVAHNAKFDFSVLCYCCEAYGLTIPQVQCIDTVELFRSLRPDLGNRKLDTLARAYTIPLEHHSSESDCLACARLLAIAMEQTDVDAFAEIYDVTASGAGRIRKQGSWTDKTKSIADLVDLLNEIIEDGVVSEAEALALSAWIKDHNDLKGTYPYDRIDSKLDEVLADGILEPDELRELLRLFTILTDPIKAIRPLGHKIDVSDKLVCITGSFKAGEKKDVAQKLQKRGAIVKNSVVKKLDYLIVGSLGSADYGAGRYGGKIRKAFENQDAGLPVCIVLEQDVF